ncbi:hypothetical protein C7M84_001419 [Penaeus vannamei]|uniref:Uncharacterized protein n=1 Tax=Penaeus vannamei TaxID=6689 RepID=A0A423TTX1_PENVA|nr:hypothetical protein C7M84_001419 [Penaeus vannamei]
MGLTPGCYRGGICMRIALALGGARGFESSESNRCSEEEPDRGLRAGWEVAGGRAERWQEMCVGRWAGSRIGHRVEGGPSRGRVATRARETCTRGRREAERRGLKRTSFFCLSLPSSPLFSFFCSRFLLLFSFFLPFAPLSASSLPLSLLLPFAFLFLLPFASPSSPLFSFFCLSLPSSPSSAFLLFSFPLLLLLPFASLFSSPSPSSAFRFPLLLSFLLCLSLRSSPLLLFWFFFSLSLFSFSSPSLLSFLVSLSLSSPFFSFRFLLSISFLALASLFSSPSSASRFPLLLSSEDPLERSHSPEGHLRRLRSRRRGEAGHTTTTIRFTTRSQSAPALYFRPAYPPREVGKLLAERFQNSYAAFCLHVDQVRVCSREDLTISSLGLTVLSTYTAYYSDSILLPITLFSTFPSALATYRRANNRTFTQWPRDSTLGHSSRLMRAPFLPPSPP